MEDKQVTLTATITKSGASKTKTFTITVPAEPASDSEAVSNAKTALEIGFAASDSANSVTQDLTLITEGIDGTVITWSTDNSVAITDQGRIFRSTSDVIVTLTALISRGTASDTKTFELTVLKSPDAVGPSIPDAPTDVRVTIGLNMATVSWNSPFHNGAEISSYTVYWGTSSGQIDTGATAVNQKSTTDGTTTMLVIDGLTNETLYYFVATATNSVGKSEASGEVSGMPSAILQDKLSYADIKATYG